MCRTALTVLGTRKEQWLHYIGVMAHSLMQRIYVILLSTLSTAFSYRKVCENHYELESTVLMFVSNLISV